MDNDMSRWETVGIPAKWAHLDRDVVGRIWLCEDLVDLEQALRVIKENQRSKYRSQDMIRLSNEYYAAIEARIEEIKGVAYNYHEESDEVLI